MNDSRFGMSTCTSPGTHSNDQTNDQPERAGIEPKSRRLETNAESGVHHTTKSRRSILDPVLGRALARARDRGVMLEVSPPVRAWPLAQNHQPELGARPLRRIVQDYVEDAPVERLLRGEIRSGEAVDAGVGENALTFTERQSVDSFGSSSATPPAKESGV